MKLMPDMNEYLKQHDLVYEAPPTEWSCGIPLANGEIGVVIWGDGNPLKLTLDKYDVWELRTIKPTDPRYNYKYLRRVVEYAKSKGLKRLPGEVRDIFLNCVCFHGKPERPYPTRIPLPRVELYFTEPITDFSARLSIYDAIAYGSLISHSGKVLWKCFVHSRENLIVLILQYEGNIKLKELKVSLDHLDSKTRQALKKWGYPDSVYGKCGEYHWLKQEFPAENFAGGAYFVIWRRFTETDSREVIYISILTFNDSKSPIDDARKVIDNAIKTGVDKLIESHKQFWAEFWNKSFIAIPDSRLENLFYVELYKLACCSMGRYPCSLQGLWSPDGTLPPWSNDYHLDMNVQATYWLVYASNHLELGKPLYEHFWKLLPKFRRFCREFFGFNGIWTRCEMAIDGTPIHGWFVVNFWPGNAAWLAHMYWLHWLYSRDKKFLKERAYPIMKACMQTYMNLLEIWPDGRYHLPLSHSPEWLDGDPLDTEAWGSDTTCDLAFIRWLAMSLIESAKILGIEDPELPKWQEILEKLAEYPQDESGLQIYRGQPLTHSHRHYSHLMAIYPLGILNIEGSKEEQELIYRSIFTWILRGTGEWAGWSFPSTALIAARVRLGNMAWHMLQTYFYFIKPNTFHVNGDYRHFGITTHTYEVMTLEGGFCAAAAILEMLLQSWGNCIRVFPAIPEFWSDAYFYRLRAEGAFLVTSKLRRGKVKFILIESEKGGTCRVLNPFDNEQVLLKDLNTNKEKVLKGKIIEFDTVPGGKYLLLPLKEGIKEEELMYLSFKRSKLEVNWFGVKKIPRF